MLADVAGNLVGQFARSLEADLLAGATPNVGTATAATKLGTPGGAIAHADPAAEYAAVALTLDAQMEAVSPRGTRDIPAAEFFSGLWENSMASDEILTAVRFPGWLAAADVPSRSSPAGTAISRSRGQRSQLKSMPMIR